MRKVLAGIVGSKRKGLTLTDRMKKAMYVIPLAIITALVSIVGQVKTASAEVLSSAYGSVWGGGIWSYIEYNPSSGSVWFHYDHLDWNSNYYWSDSWQIWDEQGTYQWGTYYSWSYLGSGSSANVWSQWHSADINITPILGHTYRITVWDPWQGWVAMELTMRAPGTPTGVSVRSGTSTSVNISFTALPAAMAVQYYKVYDNGNYIGSLNSNSGTLTGIPRSQLHSIQVSAVNSAGEGPKSAAAGLQILQPPASVSVSPKTTVGDQNVHVTWTQDNSTGTPTSYKIYVDNVYKTSVPYGTNSVDLSNIGSLGANHVIGVTQANSTSESDQKQYTYFVLQAPSATPGISVSGSTAGIATGLTVKWSANPAGDHVTGYKVYADGNYVTSTNASTFSASLPTLSLGVNHNIQVSAVNVNGEGAKGSVTYYTYPKPQAPTGLNVQQTSGELRMVWNANPAGDYVTKYNVYNGGILLGSTTSTYYPIGNLGAGSQNNITVTAVNINAESNQSSTSSYNVANAPDIPTGTGLGSSNGSGDSMTNAILINSPVYDLSISNVNANYIQYSVDGIKWSPWEVVRDSGAVAKTIKFDDTNGYHTVSMRTSNSYAADSDPSTISNITTYYFFLDTQAPVFDARTASGSNVAVGGTANFLVRATDNNPSGLKASIIVYNSARTAVAHSDSVALTNGQTQTLTISGLGTGYYYVSITVTDASGNTADKEFNIYSE